MKSAYRLLVPILALAVCCCALTAGSSAAGSGPGMEPLIRGGNLAEQGELPSVVSVNYIEGGKGWACTGTVVSPIFVLTAAHCVRPPGYSGPAGFKVYIGNVEWSSPEAQVFSVAQALVFPKYKGQDSAGDAALLQLSAPTTAPPIPVARHQIWSPGQRAVIAGFGDLEPGQSEQTKVLHRATTIIREQSSCNFYFGGHFVCVNGAPAYRAGTCPGDSGSPLLARRSGGSGGVGGDGELVEIGILKGGYCHPNRLEVYTRTEYVYRWMQKRIASVPPPG
jgi:secreted trypsin-like serine protease